ARLSSQVLTKVPVITQFSSYNVDEDAPLPRYTECQTERDGYPTSRIRMNIMNRVLHLLAAIAFLSEAQAQDVRRNIPYADPAQERQVLDVYTPSNAKNLPVVFWIHGGGWQTGDKADVHIKPQAFRDKGFVF